MVYLLTFQLQLQGYCSVLWNFLSVYTQIYQTHGFWVLHKGILNNHRYILRRRKILISLSFFLNNVLLTKIIVYLACNIIVTKHQVDQNSNNYGRHEYRKGQAPFPSVTKSCAQFASVVDEKTLNEILNLLLNYLWFGLLLISINCSSQIKLKLKIHAFANM